MTFNEIIPHLLKEEKVRRGWWDLTSFIWIPKNSSIIIDEYNEDFILEREELEADDWELYYEPDFFDFNKAHKLLKQGKKVIRLYLANPKESEKCYIYLDEEFFILHVDDSDSFYKIKSDDVDAKDWYEVK